MTSPSTTARLSRRLPSRSLCWRRRPCWRWCSPKRAGGKVTALALAVS